MLIILIIIIIIIIIIILIRLIVILSIIIMILLSIIRGVDVRPRGVSSNSCELMILTLAAMSWLRTRLPGLARCTCKRPRACCFFCRVLRLCLIMQGFSRAGYSSCFFAGCRSRTFRAMDNGLISCNGLIWITPAYQRISLC